jgi:hypothetical protein
MRLQQEWAASVAVTLVLVTMPLSCNARVADAFYDCKLREIAVDYTREVCWSTAFVQYNSQWLGGAH